MTCSRSPTTTRERGTNVLAPLPYATGVSLLVIGSVVLLALLDLWLGLVALIGMTLDRLRSRSGRR